MALHNVIVGRDGWHQAANTSVRPCAQKSSQITNADAAKVKIDVIAGR